MRISLITKLFGNKMLCIGDGTGAWPIFSILQLSCATRFFAFWHASIAPWFMHDVVPPHIIIGTVEKQ